MINILVTGAKGQLGSSIRELVKDTEQYKFIFTDSKSLDITVEKDVLDVFEHNNLDYCINCAAYTAVDKAEIETDLCYRVNADAVKILAKACAAKHCILIHVSTDFIFDGSKKEPYLENDLPNPLNVYGASKLKGEQWVEEHLEDFFIVRTSWVYSKFGYNFVKTMLKLGEEGRELNVVSDQYGAPTYAMDLAKFIMVLIEKKSEAFGLYHFSNIGSISWFDFAKAIFELSEKKVVVNPIRSSEYEVKALRPKYSVLNLEKASKLLSQPIKKWDDSLAQCLESILL